MMRAMIEFRFIGGRLLQGETELARVDNAPITLALGCWLIVNWENAPAGSADGSPAGLVWGPGS
jgi:hypothetical protein